MAELHIIGQLVSGQSLETPTTGLLCQWEIQAGSSWKKVAGPKQGQTQVDTPQSSGVSYWAHPINIHYTTKGLTGWPKLNLQVYRQDKFGRSDLCGYGVCHIPSTPGTHLIDVPLWRPTGSARSELTRYFIGGGVEVSEPDFIGNPLDRCRLKTSPSGNVSIELSTILRNFDQFGVEL